MMSLLIKTQSAGDYTTLNYFKQHLLLTGFSFKRQSGLTSLSRISKKKSGPVIEAGGFHSIIISRIFSSDHLLVFQSDKVATQ